MLRALLLILFMAVSMAPVFGGDFADLSIKSAQGLGYDQWPGKAGTLKQGFRFQAADYPLMAGSQLISETYFVDEARGVTRVADYAIGEKHVAVTMGVSFVSPAVAQELLAIHGLIVSQMTLTDFWTRGDSTGFALGDINLIHGDFAALTNISFARNNVFCYLSSDDGVDIKALALAIDAKIKAMPDVTKDQFNATAPQITTFAPATPTAKKSTTVDVTVAITDPSATCVHREYFFGSKEMELNVVDTRSVLTVGSDTGTATFGIYAINGFLQFSKAQSSVQVTE